MSTSNINLLSDATQVVFDQEDLNSKILTLEMKNEKEWPISEGQEFQINPELVIEEVEQANDSPFFSGKVRLYRDDESRLFRNRVLTLRLKVFKGASRQEF